MIEPHKMTEEERENLCKCDISVLQVGNRLQITADVDAKGIATLKEMLTKYEGILELLASGEAEAGRAILADRSAK